MSAAGVMRTEGRGGCAGPTECLSSVDAGGFGPPEQRVGRGKITLCDIQAVARHNKRACRA